MLFRSKMRSCFVASPGNLLVAADYSQIELRVLAHMSGDPTLLAAFAEGDDIHARTARLLFDKTEVTTDERRRAKIRDMVRGRERGGGRTPMSIFSGGILN